MTFKQFIQHVRDSSWNFVDNITDPDSRRTIASIAGISLGIIILLMLILMLWWDRVPSDFNPIDNANNMATIRQHNLVTGYTSTATLITISNALLNKSGGYLSNDVMPPSIWMDNIPNWEFGVLTQMRDFSRSLRNDISRSQSQSLEDPDLAIAEPQFNFNSESWLFPATENEYKTGIKRQNKPTIKYKKDRKTFGTKGRQTVNYWARFVC